MSSQTNQRGQAPLPDLFYSEFAKTDQDTNRTSQEEGLAPAYGTVTRGGMFASRRLFFLTVENSR